MFTVRPNRIVADDGHSRQGAVNNHVRSIGTVVGEGKRVRRAEERKSDRERKEEWGEGKMEGRKNNERKDEERREKDNPGPVMVSNTFCPAVHILNT